MSSPTLKEFRVLNFERDERGVRGLGLPLSTIRELKVLSFKKDEKGKKGGGSPSLATKKGLSFKRD